MTFLEGGWQAMMSSKICVLAIVVLCCACGRARAEQDLLPSITVSANNFQAKLAPPILMSTPTDIAVFPDGSGRMLVTEAYTNNIYLLNAAGELQPTVYHNTRTSDSFDFVFNDIADTTIEFHPQFAQVGSPGYGKFYTVESEEPSTSIATFTGDFQPTFSSGNSHQQVLYEYTVADHSSDVIGAGYARREVMRFRESVRSHNVNDLVFDDAGLLYIAVGDGGNSATERRNAAPLDNAFGKILRIDPLGLDGTTSANGKYSIPASNPFVNTAGAVKEIFTRGSRNPYRMSIDPVTGHLYVGEVGQDNIEEVNVITDIDTPSPGGQHFGWALKEGSYRFINNTTLQVDADANNNGVRDYAEANGLTDPLFEYDHQDGSSVLGGFVYRGSAMPWLVGKYVFAEQQGARDAGEAIPNDARFFYGDIETGDIFAFNLDVTGTALPTRLVGINQAADGEIYLLGTSALYKVGAGAIPADYGFAGDFNGDGTVDLADYTVWRDNLGASDQLLLYNGDNSGDRVIDAGDYNVWKANFGAVAGTIVVATIPEPSSVALLVLGIFAALAVKR